VPYKTCTYDCVYCQLGRTTNKTIERREYIAVEEILFELERKLSAGPVPDYISLAGSGEPTLNCRIGEMIDRIKSLTRIPVAVLTNGSLLWMPEVRKALMNADLVLPSLDAGDGDLFGFVNRPHPQIEFQMMLDGLAEFTARFSNPVWLEVFLLGGMTGLSSEVKKIAALAKHIRPLRVQLNTVTRPAFENFALAVPENALESLAELFEPRAEVIAKFKMPDSIADRSSTTEDIRSLLLRRPCTAEDLAEGLNIQRIVAIKQLEVLKETGQLKEIIKDGRRFYTISMEEQSE
jgi:wyosine [tRNA(Phe)-imidazoG37] synthetase (radical SAM superfamily)